jgi:hypothetical protein
VGIGSLEKVQKVSNAIDEFEQKNDLPVCNRFSGRTHNQMKQLEKKMMIRIRKRIQQTAKNPEKDPIMRIASPPDRSIARLKARME